MVKPPSTTIAAHLSVRMFVAVWPDVSTVRVLSGLGLPRAPRLRPVRPEHWHITLQFLGDVDDDLGPALTDALAEAAGRTKHPVHCALGPSTTWFSGGRVLQIPASGLERTAAAVRAATCAAIPGPASGPSSFAGHLTVARVKGRGLDLSTRTALAGIPCAAEFAVARFDLMASELSPGGLRYTALAQFALSGRHEPSAEAPAERFWLRSRRRSGTVGNIEAPRRKR
jgi:RNA 2',3'-cyclic 3'-phosphodiesterase